jgi:tetratricopeptide (TPR) repeat protein
VADLRDELVSALAGRYDVERELGHGGMAYVYLARDLKHDRRVAIKVLKPELAASLGGDRFLREINITARFSHPNILTLHDSGAVGGRLLYYVMPYVPGDTLQQRLDREKQLPIDEALSIARQTAAALDYAHHEGVVHRDIKPANILLLGDHVLVADFGLARMVYTAGSNKLSYSSIIIGTPAYMSPEQIAGDAELDGRTDIYSLACVFFEMLAGMPPFHGVTQQALYAQHLNAPPPSLCSERENCPPEMDDAVRRALSKVPADRFRTASEFVHALESGGITSSRSQRTSAAARGKVRTQRRWIAAAGVAAAIGVITMLAMRYMTPNASTAASALDSSRYAVIPFTARSPGTDTAMITARVADALSEWDGVQLTDDRSMNEALRKHGDGELTLADARQIARQLGAGRLVWGEGSRDADSVVVRAALYESTTENQLGTKSIRYSANDRPPSAAFRTLANALLRRGEEPPTLGDLAGGRPSLAAWRAYDEGRAAAARWDVTTAESRFRDAVTLDPEHAQAQLWLGIVQMWEGQPADAWRPATRRAVQLKDRLTTTDVKIANAQLAQAEGRYLEACVEYRQLVARDSSDVVGWYGLGECQSRDNAVIPDIKSPSGYRFRTGRQSAIRAYRHIVEDRAAPQPGFAFKRLLDLLYIEGNRYRNGVGKSGKFGAYPSLDHDTLAFIPYPERKVLDGDRSAIPRTKAEAIDHNRSVARPLYVNWVKSEPANVEARIGLALLLELTEELKNESPDGLSALAQNTRALHMSTDSTERLLLARTQVRLLAKTADWRAAAAFADSLFTALPHPVSDTMAAMVGIAALTGRIALTAEIIRAHPTSAIFQFTAADGTPIELKPAMQQDILTMYVYASLGACTDSLRDLPRRVDVALQSRVAESRRRAMRDALLANTLAFAVPCLGPRFLSGIDDGEDYVIAMEQALGRGDASSVRALYASRQPGRVADRPGDLAIEYTYIESWLLAQIGDTAAAIAHLDRSLNALPTLGRYLLDRPSQSAGLVRAMGLRAELAAAAGDRQTARRWGSPVATIWAHADPELQPYVKRMRDLAAAGS